MFFLQLLPLCGYNLIEVMKVKKTNAMRILDSKKIAYSVKEYEVNEDDLGAVAVAAKTGVDIDRIYKTLVLNGDKSGYIVACVPGAAELNLKALAKLSGNKRVEMIPMKDLEKITGYIRGGCSPVGMKKSLPTFLDTDADTYEKIVVSGGRRGVQIEVAPEDLIKICRGTGGKISF